MARPENLVKFEPAFRPEETTETGHGQIDLGGLPISDYWEDRRVIRMVRESDRRVTEYRRQNMPPTAIIDRRRHRPAYRFRRSHLLQQMFIMCGDLISLLLALLIPALVLGLFVDKAVSSNHYLFEATWQFSIVIVFFLGLNWFRGNYSKRCSLSDDLVELFRTGFYAVGLQSILAGLIGNRSILLGLLLTWAFALVLIPFVRLAIKRLMYHAGIWTRPTVIIGAGENARKTAEAIQSDWLLGFYIVEFINCVDFCPGAYGVNNDFAKKANASDNGFVSNIEICGHRIPVRNIDEINGEVFQALGCPHIVVAIDSFEFWQVIRVLYEADIPYSSLTIVPSLKGMPMIGLGMTHVFRHDVLMLTVQNNLSRFIPRLLKRLFDVVAASLLLAVLSPLLLVIAFLVRLTGKGIIFGHERIGQQGKPFRCYKFRSMVNNCDEVLEELLKNDAAARAEWEECFKLKNDPRITPIGHLLRRSSLDELPQLFNVIKGEMSLVGPRPIVTEELERYQDQLDLYHMVKPGITGLWQISGRSDLTYAERVNLDSWYSKNWSLWYDIVILCKTLQVVTQRYGAY